MTRAAGATDSHVSAAATTVTIAMNSGRRAPSSKRPPDTPIATPNAHSVIGTATNNLPRRVSGSARPAVTNTPPTATGAASAIASGTSVISTSSIS